MRDAALPGLAVGFFDGVHLGHQSLLRGASSALTFRQHPLTVLAPEKAPRLMMSCAARVAAIKACGVKDVVVLDFTRELAEMPAAEFARRYLPARPEQARIICGANWRFGKGGAGDAAFLKAHGFTVDVVPAVTHAGAPISSSRIRASLVRGDLAEANAMLGHPYAISGTVEKGKGLGRSLGFPTVNLRPAEPLLLPCGVYAVRVAGAKAVVNYGRAPTFGDAAWPTPMIEVHFLSDPSPAALACASIDCLRFLRPERSFDSPDALRAQIARDCAEAAE